MYPRVSSCAHFWPDIFLNVTLPRLTAKSISETRLVSISETPRLVKRTLSGEFYSASASAQMELFDKFWQADIGLFLCNFDLPQS